MAGSATKACSCDVVCEALVSGDVEPPAKEGTVSASINGEESVR